MWSKTKSGLILVRSSLNGRKPSLWLRHDTLHRRRHAICRNPGASHGSSGLLAPLPDSDSDEASQELGDRPDHRLGPIHVVQPQPHVHRGRLNGPHEK
jgi:hypothetical protein